MRKITLSTTTSLWPVLNRNLLKNIELYLDYSEEISFENWIIDFQLMWLTLTPSSLDREDPGFHERERLRKKVSDYFYYFPAFLRLFSASVPNRKLIWDDLLTQDGRTEKNYAIPAPILYEQAKRVILHPIQAKFQYDIQPNIQTAIRRHPFLATGMTALMVAIHPSIESLGLGLFVGLSLCLSSPSQQRSVGKVLFNLYEFMWITGLLSALNLPLVLSASVTSGIAFPLMPFIALSGLFLTHGLIANRMASHIAAFEAQNPMGINNDPLSLQRFFIQQTLSPFKAPLLLSGGMAMGLLLPSDNLAIRGLLALTRTYSCLEIVHLTWKVFKKQISAHELISLGFLLYQKSPSLFSLMNPPSCREISPFQMLNLQWLSFPVDANSALCHERSGKQWAISTPPHTEHRSAFFTAHSLRQGYQYLPGIEDICPEEGFALMPKTKLTNPIEYLCGLSPHSCEGNSWLPDIRASVPIDIWNAEGFHQKGPFLFTTDEKIALLKELPLSALLFYEGHKTLNHVKKMRSQTVPPQTSQV